MHRDRTKQSYDTALAQELAAIERRELRLTRAAERYRSAPWKAELESRLPDKVRAALQAAFLSAFQLVFSKGTAVIEKSYDRKKLTQGHRISDYMFEKQGGRSSLREMNKSASDSRLVNLAITTAEGVGLGALGVGIPDVPVYVAMLLKGVYETALQYGFEYGSAAERALILRMMEASVTRGAKFVELDAQVDALLRLDALPPVDDAALKERTESCAESFAVDMLLLKSVQSLPVVGIVGGLANPVYYQRVLGYVSLKYRKRYLLGKLKSAGG